MPPWPLWRWLTCTGIYKRLYYNLKQSKKGGRISLPASFFFEKMLCDFSYTWNVIYVRYTVDTCYYIIVIIFYPKY